MIVIALALEIRPSDTFLGAVIEHEDLDVARARVRKQSILLRID
jgi:hypothetical protein